MRQAGYRGPLSWYKAAMRGVNHADEAEVPDSAKVCAKPVLLVVSENDYVTRAEVQMAKCKEWVPNLQVEMLDCGHWIQLEQPARLLGLLEKFASDIVAADCYGSASEQQPGALATTKQARSDKEIAV
jgi:soluble epoxide hydrolase/lipid-phosphate phosphatase